MIKLDAVIYLGLSKEVRALKSYFLDQDLACTPLAFKIEDREIIDTALMIEGLDDMPEYPKSVITQKAQPLWNIIQMHEQQILPLSDLI
ncbi:MAG: hypothetical protein AB8W21_00130 [Coxiella endosymbiont of Dermacentor silvarum]